MSYPPAASLDSFLGQIIRCEGEKVLDSQRRKAGPLGRTKASRAVLDSELSTSRHAEYLELARQWRPFGGVPEEEIFVRFGISKTDFDDAVAAADRVAAQDADRKIPSRIGGSRF